jgi:hypothetical protein
LFSDGIVCVCVCVSQICTGTFKKKSVYIAFVGNKDFVDVMGWGLWAGVAAYRRSMRIEVGL